MELLGAKSEKSDKVKNELNEIGEHKEDLNISALDLEQSKLTTDETKDENTFKL